MQQTDTAVARSMDTAFFGHPKQLRSLFFTEMWERFSFYGIRPLLVLYMIAVINEGGLGLDRPTATAIVGLYTGSLYLASLPGGWLADNWLGQKNAVWYGSVIIALGHLSIALTALFGSPAFFVGLAFIVVGTGLFKTCVTVMVGALYSDHDPRRNSGFSLFYMGINLGAFISPFITGYLIQSPYITERFGASFGWHMGFGIGGIGMLIALLIFRFVTVPSMRHMAQVKGIKPFWEFPATRREGVGKVVAGIVALIAAFAFMLIQGIIVIDVQLVASSLIYIITASMVGYFVYLIGFAGYSKAEKIKLAVAFLLMISAVLFFAILEQSPTSFNLFAEDFTNRDVGSFVIPTPWFQSIQPFFVIIFAPTAGWLWIKLSKKKLEPSNINKFALALVICAVAYGIMYLAVVEVIDSNGLVSPLYLLFSMGLLSLGEVFLSPIGLSSMTTLAPHAIRGQMIGLWFAATALANLVAGLIGGNVSQENLLELPTLFGRCVIVVIIAAVLLFVLSKSIQRMLDKAHAENTGQ